MTWTCHETGHAFITRYIELGKLRFSSVKPHRTSGLISLQTSQHRGADHGFREHGPMDPTLIRGLGV